MSGLDLSLVPGTLAVCRLPPSVPPPNWALAGRGFLVFVRTPDELSVIAPSESLPERLRREDGWRAFRVDTPLDFSATGVIASLATPLADAGIPVLAVATHDTDYVLVREDAVDAAVEALSAAGHRFPQGEPGRQTASDQER